MRGEWVCEKLRQDPNGVWRGAYVRRTSEGIQTLTAHAPTLRALRRVVREAGKAASELS